MIYEYKCDNCSIVIEDWHSVKEEPEIKCEKCGKVMRKLITGGAATHYVGQGWVSKGSGGYSNPKETTKEVGVAINPAYKNALNPEITKKR